MPKRSVFVRELMARYKEAASEEQQRIEAYENASRDLADTRDTKKHCAALLRKEGIDTEGLVPDTQSEGNSPAKEIVAQHVQQAETNGFLPVTPLNDTHAVFLLMKKFHNTGFKAEELSGCAKQGGLSLSPVEITRVFWRQIGRKHMEKLEDGRVRLTPKGEGFTGFRRQTVKGVGA
jgi:hypothetical protein